jgi:hypothetical protein
MRGKLARVGWNDLLGCPLLEHDRRLFYLPLAETGCIHPRIYRDHARCESTQSTSTKSPRRAEGFYC